LNLRLPTGYHVALDTDVLLLRRADDSQVALFSRRGFVAEVVERAAWEDYGEEERPEGSSRSRSSRERRVLSHPRDPRVRRLSPRPPE
jgi:hypothetical protein